MDDAVLVIRKTTLDCTQKRKTFFFIVSKRANMFHNAILSVYTVLFSSFMLFSGNKKEEGCHPSLSKSHFSHCLNLKLFLKTTELKT